MGAVVAFAVALFSNDSVRSSTLLSFRKSEREISVGLYAKIYFCLFKMFKNVSKDALE